MDQLNTHFYDGRLDNSLEAELEKVKMLPKEEKLRGLALLREHLPATSFENFDIIMNEFLRGGPLNYDSSNNLHAEDLLYLCSQSLEKYSWDHTLIDLLNTQFIDMNTGICPQGRTHRLFQVALALI